MRYPEIVTLKDQASKPIRPTQIIYHSLGNGYNFDAGVDWLLDPGNPLESHIAVRKDGLRRLLVPYTQRAEANYHANRRPDGTGALAAETDSSIEASEPWTDDQVQSLIEWTVDRCIEFDIPPVLCTSPTAPGLGWHIMWGSPGEWTPARKVCPGPERIFQVINVIQPEVARRVAAIKAGGGTSPSTPTAPPSPEEDEMSQQQIDQITKAITEGFAAVTKRIDELDTDVDNARTLLNQQEKRLGNVIAPMEAAVNGIRELLNQQPIRLTAAIKKDASQ